MSAHLLHPRLSEGQIMAELFESEHPLHLVPDLTSKDLPPEFEDVLQVQVVGYRERLIAFCGRRIPVLDPIWTLVPKDR